LSLKRHLNFQVHVKKASYGIIIMIFALEAFHLYDTRLDPQQLRQTLAQTATKLPLKFRIPTATATVRVTTKVYHLAILAARIG
jgi:hypothetical protein